MYQQSAESPFEGVDQRAYPQVTVVAAPAQVNDVQNRVRTYLRGPSDASQLVPESVELSAETSGDFVDRIEEIINRITRFVTGIGVIALVVAAIGSIFPLLSDSKRSYLQRGLTLAIRCTGPSESPHVSNFSVSRVTTEIRHLTFYKSPTH